MIRLEVGRRLAKALSYIFTPYIHPLYISILASYVGVLDLKASVIVITLYSVIPLATHLAIAKIFRVDTDISMNRFLRLPVIVIALLCYVLSLVLVGREVIILAAPYIATAIVAAIATLFDRVSIHVLSFAPPIIIALRLNLEYLALVLAMLAIAIGWSRLVLGAHNSRQVAEGLLLTAGLVLGSLLI